MKLLISGPPGCGKTTLCERIIDRLKERMRIGGFVSREIVEGVVRKGFMLRDIRSWEEGILAHVDQKAGPRVGRYRVNLGDLKTVGVGAIYNALQSCDLVVIDEIGPMELYSEDFVRAVKDAFASDKHVIATIHFGTKNKLVKRLALENVPIRLVFEGNREALLEEVVEKFF